MNTKNLSLTIVFATLLTMFGFYNLGIESIFYPFAIAFGVPCVYGLTLGHLIMTVYHGFGMLDFFTPAILFAPKYLMAKYGRKTYFLHCLAQGFWLPVIDCSYGRFPFVLYPLLVVGQCASQLVFEGIGVILASKVQKRYQL